MRQERTIHNLAPSHERTFRARMLETYFKRTVNQRPALRSYQPVTAERCFLLGMTLAVLGCLEPPTITTDDDTALREKMTRDQFSGPDRIDITSEEVLKAMKLVPRHSFVPESQRPKAYEDRPLPIGHGQTISQPYIVALMTEKLDPNEDDRVLEIGTGSGYQAAVLANLVKDVYTIEIVEPLGKRAAETLEKLNYENVHVCIGDGYKGWPEQAPFDAIIVTCAPEHVPQPLVDQLKEGGRMMIPVGKHLQMQDLYLLEKSDGKLTRKSVLQVRFVPMTGQARKSQDHSE